MGIPLADFLPLFKRRPGAYVLRGSYLATCAFLTGYEAGSQEHVLMDFHAWLVQRQNGRPELTWHYLVLLEIVDDRGWPDLRDFSPEEDEQAIAALFSLLEEFSAARGRGRSSTDSDT